MARAWTSREGGGVGGRNSPRCFIQHVIRRTGIDIKKTLGFVLLFFWGWKGGRGGGCLRYRITSPPHLALQYIGYISVGLETYLTILGILGVRLFKLLFVTQIYRECGVQVVKLFKKTYIMGKGRVQTYLWITGSLIPQ